MEFFIVRNMIVKRNKKWDGIPLTLLKTGRSLYSMALLIFVMKSILEKSPFPQWAESIPPLLLGLGYYFWMYFRGKCGENRNNKNWNDNDLKRAGDKISYFNHRKSRCTQKRRNRHGEEEQQRAALGPFDDGKVHRSISVFYGTKARKLFLQGAISCLCDIPLFSTTYHRRIFFVKVVLQHQEHSCLGFLESNMHYEYSRYFIQSIKWENASRFSQRPWKSYFLTQLTKKIIHLNLENETCMNMCRNRNLPTCQWKHTQINPFTVKLILLITLLSWASIDSPPLQFLALYPTT